VGFLFATHPFRGFVATVLFSRTQTQDNFLGFLNLCLGNLASLILFGTIAHFSFNSLPLVLSATARDLFFLFVPARLLGSQRVF
jgi:hypothetical protein